MGYRKEWDMNAIKHQIWTIRYEANNHRNDGWTCFGAKQDLYELKWLIDESLAKCSEFSGEEEWLKEKEQEKIIEILKR